MSAAPAHQRRVARRRGRGHAAALVDLERRLSEAVQRATDMLDGAEAAEKGG